MMTLKKLPLALMVMTAIFTQATYAMDKEEENNHTKTVARYIDLADHPRSREMLNVVAWLYEYGLGGIEKNAEKARLLEDKAIELDGGLPEFMDEAELLRNKDFGNLGFYVYDQGGIGTGKEKTRTQQKKIKMELSQKENHKDSLERTCNLLKQKTPICENLLQRHQQTEDKKLYQQARRYITG